MLVLGQAPSTGVGGTLVKFIYKGVGETGHIAISDQSLQPGGETNSTGKSNTPPTDMVSNEAIDAAVALSIILISIGVAVNIAQAIAAALAQAIRTGVEFTNEEINNAIVDGLDNAFPENDIENSLDPPDPLTHKGPTFYDKEGEPFERNRKGKYWAPDSKGKWRWLGEKDARAAEAAFRGENIQRQRERENHDRETQKNLERSRQKIRAQHEAEQRAEAAQLADQEKRQKELVAQLDREIKDAEKVEKERQEKREEDKQSKKHSQEDKTQDQQGDDTTPGWDNTGLGWAVNFGKEFFRGVCKDTNELTPESMAKDAVPVILDGMRQAAKTLANPENWRIAAETAEGTVKDAMNPENWRVISETVVDTVKDTWGVVTGDEGSIDKLERTVIGKTIVETGRDIKSAITGDAERLDKVSTNVTEGFSTAAETVWKNKAEIAKTMLGVDHWKEAINPDVPVRKRMVRVALGTLDTATMVHWAGKTVVSGMGKVVAAADKLEGMVRAAKVGDKAGNAFKAAEAGSEAAKIANAVGDRAKGGASELYDEAADFLNAQRKESLKQVETRLENLSSVRRKMNLDDPGVVALEGRIRELDVQRETLQQRITIADNMAEADATSRTAVSQVDNAELEQLARQREQEVRELIRKEGYRDDLADRMGYRHDHLSHKISDGIDTKKGSVVMNKSKPSFGTGNVYSPAYVDPHTGDPLSILETQKTALHEARHIMQSGRTTTLGHYNPDGSLTRLGSLQLELENKMADIDWALAHKGDALKKANIATDPLEKAKWFQEAGDAQKIIDNTARYLRSDEDGIPALKRLLDES
jgi:hypothetical protein